MGGDLRSKSDIECTSKWPPATTEAAGPPNMMQECSGGLWVLPQAIVTTYTKLPDLASDPPSPPRPFGLGCEGHGEGLRRTWPRSQIPKLCPYPPSSTPTSTQLALLQHWLAPVSVVWHLLRWSQHHLLTPCRVTPSARSPSPWSSETSPSLARIFVLMVFAYVQGRNFSDD